MNSTDVLTITENGDLTLPVDVLERYHIEKEMKFRIVEKRDGVLLIPLTDEPMNGKLKAEIKDWQSLGEDSWDKFDYEEDLP